MNAPPQTRYRLRRFRVRYQRRDEIHKAFMTLASTWTCARELQRSFCCRPSVARRRGCHILLRDAGLCSLLGDACTRVPRAAERDQPAPAPRLDAARPLSPPAQEGVGAETQESGGNNGHGTTRPYYRGTSIGRAGGGHQKTCRCENSQ